MTLHIDQLDYAYGRIRALSNIGVRAERGRVIALIGPNASGKSTLLRCIIGALRPQRGSVMLGGENVHRLSPRALARRIAYVPQRSVVSAMFSVRQVVELGRYALPPDRRRIDEAVERLDLGDVQHRPYRTLSVGQQQRVTLARALAQLESGGVLALDEPTAAMDLQHAAAAYQLLKEVAADGALVLIAMHDLMSAALFADEAWLLHRGELKAAGRTCAVMEPAQLQEVFGVEFEWVNDRAGRARLLSHASA